MRFNALARCAGACYTQNVAELFGALLLVLVGCRAALPASTPSSHIRRVAQDSLSFASPPAERFGRTPPLRLIYYILPDDTFYDQDREAIARQVHLIQEFYGHFGLEIPTEDHVYEVRASTDGWLARDFYGIIDQLVADHLYARGRTVVFADFDAGLGSQDEMALTSITSPRVHFRECPRNHDGRTPWWCGRQPDAHPGGCVHEVGHLLGLKHPDFGWGPRTVMGDHWQLGRDPRLGLLPADIEILKRRYWSAKETGK